MAFPALPVPMVLTLLQVLCLAHIGSGQLCSWITSNLTWAAGARLELSISNIQQVCVLVIVITHLGGGLERTYYKIS